ncbi:type I CRISPR-associated protein Cas7 [Virgibacillus proomii]|uniref:type I CRISPR-associated protein Cas7 n=1 Tax=Virgibacillus proomii TaxID=84407 RepID=UPI001C115ED5|nr:type I CRISPR-associated protein Cas7 [Virgibacillus proomii]MBU5267078.1 type I CRISPR-associated protein Cas7 [Virgibacillus proomii]
MWDLDRSASRGQMATRGLYVFEHESEFGNAPSHMLFKAIQIERKEDVEVPRSAADYNVNIEDVKIEGIKLHQVVGL